MRAHHFTGLLAVFLAGCGLPPPSPELVTAITFRTPMPEPPQWAAPYMDRALSQAFPRTRTDCIGNIDAVDQRYDGDPAGVRLAGWGWDSAHRAPFARLVVTDQHGRIVGAGTSGISRPDTQQTFPTLITTPNTGYNALAGVTAGAVSIYGLDEGARTVCLLRRDFPL